MIYSLEMLERDRQRLLAEAMECTGEKRHFKQIFNGLERIFYSIRLEILDGNTCVFFIGKLWERSTPIEAFNKPSET